VAACLAAHLIYALATRLVGHEDTVRCFKNRLAPFQGAPAFYSAAWASVDVRFICSSSFSKTAPTSVLYHPRLTS